MLVIISPAKKLYTANQITARATHPLPKSSQKQPIFFKEALQIVKELQTKKPSDLKKFLADKMAISDKLAVENRDRFLSFQPNPHIGTPAVFTFAGDTFQGLNPTAWNNAEQQVAANHLYILSGLYGLLKPFDLIQPYRMEMGTVLPIDGAKNLYQFWQEKITNHLQDEKEMIVNCASHEYSSVIAAKKLPAHFVTTDFKMKKNGAWQSPGMMIKKYRGLLASAIIKHMATHKKISLADIKNFTIDNYQFAPDMSDDNFLCFVA